MRCSKPWGCSTSGYGAARTAISRTGSASTATRSPTCPRRSCTTATSGRSPASCARAGSTGSMRTRAASACVVHIAFRARVAALRVRSGSASEQRRAPAAAPRTGATSARSSSESGRAVHRGGCGSRSAARRAQARLESRTARLLQLQRLALTTQRGPTRRVWSVLYAGVLGFVTRTIRWRERDTAVYVKGSFAFDDPVYGVSDIDMVVVTPDHPSRPGENRVRVQRTLAAARSSRSAAPTALPALVGLRGVRAPRGHRRDVLHVRHGTRRPDIAPAISAHGRCRMRWGC